VRVENDDALTPRQAEQLFRIAQEAVTNVLRHANAAHLWIEGGAAGEHYLLAIEDDGAGFDPSAVRPGALGLVGMRERAHLAGGDCRWAAPRRGGTRVEIRLPLAAAQAA
jgi:signal transduction histidine kinase